ncbi:MAG: hypothetical protein QM698_11570 [Micropepsaceae bacterium]
MGRETKTDVRSDKISSEARVHLDSERLTIGPPFRRRLALAGLGARAEAGGLTVTHGEERFQIAMSEKEAAAWTKSILNPPSLTDKLGLKAGVTAVLIGALPGEVRAAARGAAAYRTPPAKLTAALAIAAVTSLDAKPLAALAAALPPKGAVWLVYEKGVLKGDALIFAARDAGLKDTTVAKISETHTALRFIAR